MFKNSQKIFSYWFLTDFTYNVRSNYFESEISRFNDDDLWDGYFLIIFSLFSGGKFCLPCFPLIGGSLSIFYLSASFFIIHFFDSFIKCYFSSLVSVLNNPRNYGCRSIGQIKLFSFNFIKHYSSAIWPHGNNLKFFVF